MKLEDLIKLRNMYNKKYYCAFIEEEDLVDKKLYVNPTTSGLGIYQNPISFSEINRLLNTDEAIRYFEYLTEQFIYFLGEKNISLESSFQVSIAPSYFFDSSLMPDEAYIDSIDINHDYKVLNEIINFDLEIEYLPLLEKDIFNEKDLEEFYKKFHSTKHFVVNYNEFVKALTELGYSVKFKTFIELFAYNKEITTNTPIELTTINFIKEKTLKK